MLKKIFTLTAITLTCFISIQPAYAVIVDRIVAIVNNNVITMSELQAKTYPVMEQYIRQGAPREEVEAEQNTIMARLLPQLIDEILVEKEAKKLGIKVYDKEIEAAIDRICQQNNISRQELDSRMKAEGLSLEKYKKELKKQIERARIINANVQSKIVITDEQVMKFIGKENNSAGYGGPYYTLDHICIIPEDPTSQESKKKAMEKAEQALAELKSGKDFAEVAREYSDLPSKEQGGRLGVFSMDEMAPFVRDNVSGLSPGEYSRIIDTPAGYQIFKVSNISNKQELNIAPEKIAEIREKLYKIEINEKFEEWLKDLRKKATIKILL